jgi:hypothetical protein
MLDKKRIAYWAGFFDGEGCITLLDTAGKKDKKGRYFKLHINISQCNRQILEDLANDFDGRIYTHHRYNKSNHRQAWAWEASPTQAARFLRAIEPYVILKRDQVKLALDYYDRSSIEGQRGPYKRLTEEEISYRQTVFQTLRDMKHGS